MSSFQNKIISSIKLAYTFLWLFGLFCCSVATTGIYDYFSAKKESATILPLSSKQKNVCVCMNELYISSEFLRFFRHEGRLFVYVKNNTGQKVNKIDVLVKRKTILSEYSFEMKNVNSGNCSDRFYAGGYYVFPLNAVEVFKGYNKIELFIPNFSFTDHDDIYGLIFFDETKSRLAIYIEFLVALLAFMFSYIFHLVVKRTLSMPGHAPEHAPNSTA